MKRSILVRNKSLSNPEAPIKSVFTVDPEVDENDYQVKFMLDLMEACCLNETVPVIVCRVLLNYLFNLIMD